MKRSGFTLVEVLLALLVFSACGLVAMQMLDGAARAGADGSADELSSALAGELMDRLLASGYRGLAGLVAGGETAGTMDLPALGGAMGDDERLPWTATWKVEEAAPGLLRAEVVLAWPKPGRDRTARLVTVRFLADPLHAADVNAPLGGLP